jgi:hypothetical protein
VSPPRSVIIMDQTRVSGPWLTVVVESFTSWVAEAMVSR